MSHFTVLVIGDDPTAQLAPFQENNMGDCPKEYLQFVDNEDEYVEEYKTGTREMVVMPDGRLLAPWDDEFRVPGTFGTGGGSHKVPEGLEQRKVPFVELYKTFEEFCHEWHGCEERDEEANRYGYWENPNRKWDWYELGGRWTGFYKLKAGSEGVTGRPGLMTEAAKPGYADAAYKRDIDFGAMRNAAMFEAGQRWDRINSIIAPYKDGYISWDKMRDELYKDDIDGARTAYHAQPLMKALSDAKEHMWGGPDEYLKTRENYVEIARQNAICTFAVIKDGQWYERGSMGWFGIVSDEKADDVWVKEFNDLVDGLSDETLLSVFDCHI